MYTLLILNHLSPVICLVHLDFNVNWRVKLSDGSRLVGLWTSRSALDVTWLPVNQMFGLVNIGYEVLYKQCLQWLTVSRLMLIPSNMTHMNIRDE